MQLVPLDDAGHSSARWSLRPAEVGLLGRQVGRRPRPRPASPPSSTATRRVAQVVEHPPQSRGDPATDVVVGDDEVVVADARPGRGAARRPAGEGRGWRPGRRTRRHGQVAVQVEVDRARAGARRRTRARPAPGLPRYQRTSTIRRSGSPSAGSRLPAEMTGRASGLTRRGFQRAAAAEPSVLSFARRGAGSGASATAHGGPSLRRSSVVERAAVNRLS